MKNILFILMLATLTMSSTCSKSDDMVSAGTSINSSNVPSAVINNFNIRYPAASRQVEWEKENGNTYKVKFFIGS